MGCTPPAEVNAGRGVNPGHGAKPSLEVNLSRGTNPGREVNHGCRVIVGRGANPGHGVNAWPQSPSRAMMGPWPGAVGDPQCVGEGVFGVRVLSGSGCFG